MAKLHRGLETLAYLEVGMITKGEGSPWQKGGRALLPRKSSTGTIHEPSFSQTKGVCTEPCKHKSERFPSTESVSG